MADIVKRGEYPISEWESLRDPFRMMRELMRWDPFRAMGFAPQLERDVWMPHFEVRENGSAIRILADLPGVKREDLELSVSGNRLVVHGHREAQERNKDENVHTFEREYGAFTRTFMLPDNCEVDQITSELREGVLTIVVPLKEGAKARKIPIGGAAPKH